MDGNVTSTTTATAPAEVTTTVSPGRATTTTAPATVSTKAPTTVAALRPVKIMVSGESTAGATGSGIRTWGRTNGRAEVEIVGTKGCALQQDGDAYWRDGFKQGKNPDCLSLIDYTVTTARRSQPDLIVLFIGSNQLSDWLLPGQTVATHIGDPAFDNLYTRAATAALRKLTALGIPILFTTTPVPNIQIPAGAPGTGPMKMNDADRARRLNDLSAAVVRGLPVTEMVRYAERISNPDGTVPSSIRPDGLHLLPEAVPAIMERGLEADLRSSYQQVIRRVPSAARPGTHIWSLR